MDEHDPMSPESSNPFYVPDRTKEMLGFVGFGAMIALVPFGFGLPYSAVNLAVVASFALCAVMMLLEGLKARRYRLRRLRSVSELHRQIERPVD
ncbi:hypothetical protein NDN01_01710 [Sphingomonas sp. QA11]|uniref:hypothetical protein n=1 Tax=Sphingomonas sp. QA11 TaxID=2950605 RepID=UPI002348FF8C|nr:hypothetical protein [Sphingomonas sp. QA11]WCM27675.1 hypothetical protein NDN01_01710 [Sphingomonas sp. QA11]